MNQRMSLTRIAEQAIGTIVGSVVLMTLNTLAGRLYYGLPLGLMIIVLLILAAFAIAWPRSRKLLGRVAERQ